MDENKMIKNEWPKSQLIKTSISKYVWRIKDYGLAKRFNFNGTRTKENRIGNSDYLW